MGSYLTPLEVCERLIGTRGTLAAICGLQKKGAFFWNRPSKWRAAGDILPGHQRRLLAFSAAHGLGMTAEHLVRGATPAEIETILAARDVLPAGMPAGAGAQQPMGDTDPHLAAEDDTSAAVFRHRERAA